MFPPPPARSQYSVLIRVKVTGRPGFSGMATSGKGGGSFGAGGPEKMTPHLALCPRCGQAVQERPLNGFGSAESLAEWQRLLADCVRRVTSSCCLKPCGIPIGHVGLVCPSRLPGLISNTCHVAVKLFGWRGLRRNKAPDPLLKTSHQQGGVLRCGNQHRGQMHLRGDIRLGGPQDSKCHAA